MRFKTLFQRYPVASYFILAYAISWGGSFLVGGPKFLSGETMTFAESMRMAILMLAGPCIAGILMTYLVDGINGLRGAHPGCSIGAQHLGLAGFRPKLHSFWHHGRPDRWLCRRDRLDRIRLP